MFGPFFWPLSPLPFCAKHGWSWPMASPFGCLFGPLPFGWLAYSTYGTILNTF
jgi:hypothetical protein